MSPGIAFSLGLVFLCVAFVFAQGPKAGGEEATPANRQMYRLAALMLALAGLAHLGLGVWGLLRGEA